MNNTIQYKGYIGSVEFSEEDGLFFGKVMGVRSLISYEGETAKELIADFHGAVDDYLKMCEAEHRTPEVAYSGIYHGFITGYAGKTLSKILYRQTD